ncbi:MAG: hypothetical protein JWM27_3130, partial [Gemmatimonadetes bacterium]|nr:hypothetical protein [Gemmatimonadota bacterium]
MPLPLENLDDLTYAGLVEEARSRIPGLAPEWTNHNPSDPGITLLELLAWRTEMLVYRTNQVPSEHVVAFLKLLRGPGWTPGPLDDDAVAAEARRTVLDLRARFRAVTADDYEQLALEDFGAWVAEQARMQESAGEPVRRCARAAAHLDASLRAAADTPPGDACPFCLAGTDCPVLESAAELAGWWSRTGVRRRGANLPSRVSPVARALCIPNRDLEARRPERRRRSATGHVSLLVVPAWHGATPARMHRRAGPDAARAAADDTLRRALWGFLDERRTLTTHHHVATPDYVPVRVRAVVVLRRVSERELAVAPEELDAAREAGEATDEASYRSAFWSRPAEMSSRPLAAVLRRFFDPVAGGRDRRGWPFGRSAYVSELYELLEAEELVEQVVGIALASPDPRARLLWNDDAEAFGLSLGAPPGEPAGMQLLPRLEMDAEDVLVGERAVPVEVVLSMPDGAGAPSDPALRGQAAGAMHAAVRSVFPPFGAPASPAAAAAANDFAPQVVPA